MRVHLIAIGGSAMHNMAIALHQNGHVVSGSDDQIFEPSRSRLKQHGLLPEEGWNAAHIQPDIDVVILGMHARANNPELIRAQELGITIMSYPEFVYHEARDKKRVVIAGSHGKTTITSMVLHVLRKQKVAFDYLVGAQLTGFDTMVQFSNAPLMIIEGDEYLSSPIDMNPKFLWYQPHLTCISGIAWDHINVFPTEKDYEDQFQRYLDTCDDATIVYGCADDPKVVELLQNNAHRLQTHTYSPEAVVQKQGEWVHAGSGVSLKIKGQHNVKNLFAAWGLCKELGISESDFWASISDFSGAAKRLEEVPTQRFSKLIKDFAHAPSKVKATTQAMSLEHGKDLVAVLELHTFSSLNKDFLPQYSGTLSVAHTRVVFFDPAALAHKQLPPLSEEEVRKAFSDEGLLVFSDAQQLFSYLQKLPSEKVLLMMSSGNWGGEKWEDWIV